MYRAIPSASLTKTSSLLNIFHIFFGHFSPAIVFLEALMSSNFPASGSIPCSLQRATP
jgi:hypothetical protein